MSESVAVLVDTTRCTGCEKCVGACKKVNSLGPDRPRPGQQRIDSLSSTRYSTILRRPGNHFVKQQCRHCLTPACVSVCPVGAMQKTAEGPVVYDSERCIGCRYCQLSCPYGVPKYEWDAAVPYVTKCTLCQPRLAQGKKPACVEACPKKALSFGRRDDLLAEARRRIRQAPNRYLDHVWGEHEVGGTSVLYVSDIGLDFLMWTGQAGERALPELSWAALKKVPWVIVAMGGAMSGVHWVVQRRMARAAETVDAPAEPEASEDEKQ